MSLAGKVCKGYDAVERALHVADASWKLRREQVEYVGREQIAPIS